MDEPKAEREDLVTITASDRRRRVRPPDDARVNKTTEASKQI